MFVRAPVRAPFLVSPEPLPLEFPPVFEFWPELEVLFVVVEEFVSDPDAELSGKKNKHRRRVVTREQGTYNQVVGD